MIIMLAQGIKLIRNVCKGNPNAVKTFPSPLPLSKRRIPYSPKQLDITAESGSMSPLTSFELNSNRQKVKLNSP